jgi:hypothetical protein
MNSFRNSFLFRSLSRLHYSIVVGRPLHLHTGRPQIGERQRKDGPEQTRALKKKSE